jgi:large subunit ribosomal protein L9
MKVILKDNVYKHGVAGDVVTVADGFARNYLIPRGLAVKATAGALRDNAHLMQHATVAREQLNSELHEIASKIDGVELVFGVKAGKNNKLYGSITTMDIAAALKEKTGMEVNRRRISERPLRELGIHEIPVRLSASASPMLRIVIVREEELAAYLQGDLTVAEVTAEEAGEEVEAPVEETSTESEESAV